MATAIPRSHARFTAEEVVRATGGTLLRGAPTATTRGVETDTRAVAPGDLFVALRGERHDAHTLLDDAVAAGAAGLVVDRDVSVGGDSFVVRVGDTLRALGDLGHAHRARLSAKVVAITGSVGKTTTKDLCAAVLGALGERVHRTEGNLNNLVGLPRTLLAAPDDATVIVAEIGMNVPGEIARLTEIAAPDVGVVTSVSEVHTEGVGSLAGVAKEKGALLLGLSRDATAIATIDDEILAPYLASSPAGRKLTFGRGGAATVRVASREAKPTGSTVRFVSQLDGRSDERTVALRLVGEGAAKNAAAALALALVLRGPDALDAATAALETLRAPAGRMDLTTGAFGILLLDDTYNASPRAMENALEAAADLARGSGGRLVVVLGDMLELGALETELHARVGETVARLGASFFVACGARMRAAAEDARELGADLVLEIDDAVDAIEPVRTFVREHDVVLVKGSRGMRMERVVAALRTSAETPRGEPERGAA